MTDSKSEISFGPAGLGTVLKGHLLAVPPHQREYAWESKQVLQLLQDFSKAIQDNETQYFLGTVVTIDRDEGLEVIDGQQRLATTAILLAAIRDYLKEKKETVLVESINGEFLTGINRTKRERVPRLRLNVNDNDLFAWMVSREGEKPAVTKLSHQLLEDAYKRAYQHVRSIVSQLDERNHGDALDTWVSFIEKRAIVLFLRVSDVSNAYKMFETLNDRGLKTTQADLIKSYLFGRAEKRQAEVQSRWAHMRGALESLDEDDITVTFLRHALIVMEGYIREAQVFESVQKNVKGAQGAVTFATTLENLASSYVATFSPFNEKWNSFPDKARRSIEVLNLLSVKPLRPLLLAISAKMTGKEAAAALQFIVSMTVRMVISGATHGTVEQAIAAAANEVFTGAIETAKDLKKKLLEVTPNNESFKLAMESARVSSPKIARYYLRAMEIAHGQEPEPWFLPNNDTTIINLEHILPKKTMGNWPTFTQDEADLWVNRLGNQALLRAGDNSNFGSVGFDAKKANYAACPFKLTSQLSEFSEWTPDVIARRQKALAAMAVKAWPI